MKPQHQKTSLSLLFSTVALVWLVAGLCSTPVQAGSDMGDTINVAGRQRMLTQKMSKEALLVAAGIDAATNRENLRKTADLFHSSLAGLQDFGHKDIAAQLSVVSGMWNTFRQYITAVLDGDTSGALLQKIASENMPFLKNMNAAVQLYAKAAGSSMSQELANTIDVAGRQRMLTQKMSKETLLIAAGIDTAANTKHLQKTANLFDSTLKGLKDFGHADIAAQLQEVSGLWGTFHSHILAVLRGDTSPNVLQSIATSNMPLLKSMNKAVQMYAKLAQ